MSTIVNIHGGPLVGEDPPSKPVRRGPKIQRNYPSGKRDRLTSAWTTNSASIHDVISDQLGNIRAASRQQYAASPYYRRYLEGVVSNVVGPKGIRMQSRMRGRNGRQQKRVNQRIDAAWDDYGQRRNFSRSGQLSWLDSQRLTVSSVVMDGESLWRSSRGPQGGKYGLVWTPIDPARVSHYYDKTLPNGGQIRHGIEYNRFDRPVAYHISPLIRYRVQDAGGDFSQAERVPARNIVHIFRSEYVGQGRGIPWGATAIKQLYQIEDYIENSITNARVGSGKMGFIVDPEGRGYPADGEDAEGDLINSIEPGIIERLPPGCDFKPFNPDYPAAEFSAFLKQLLRGASSGLPGASYNIIANDLEGVSFSTIRTAVLEDREFWKGIQEWLIDSLCREVHAKWVAAQTLSDQVPEIRAELPIEEYLSPHWQPRRWAWVDPLKDWQTSDGQIEKGLRSPSQHIRDQGEDPLEVWDEYERDRNEMAARGIVPAADEPPAPASSQTQVIDDES